MKQSDFYDPPRSVVTIQVQMQQSETITDFIARLKREHIWQHGDTVVFLSHKGRFDTARISRPSW